MFEFTQGQTDSHAGPSWTAYRAPVRTPAGITSPPHGRRPSAAAPTLRYRVREELGAARSRGVGALVAAVYLILGVVSKRTRAYRACPVVDQEAAVRAAGRRDRVRGHRAAAVPCRAESGPRDGDAHARRVRVDDQEDVAPNRLRLRGGPSRSSSTPSRKGSRLASYVRGGASCRGAPDRRPHGGRRRAPHAGTRRGTVNR